ncbi:MAG: RdgB/HAM1 family non-canonical purine NTP pyrophosphatase [Candidatus Acidiferrum sp.]
MLAPVKLYLASSNPEKLAEFRALARSAATSASEVELALAPWFDSLPLFEEDAPTFAENALGKALHYSRGHNGFVFADDSGLVVPVLDGAPGVKSARYAGASATSAERNEKLLRELEGRRGPERAAYFVCVIALVERGRAVAIVSDRVDGMILETPRGDGGFGYDPVFYFSELGKSFAELSSEEKNKHSHRGKAFRRLLALTH